jgi:uncharacterized protein
VRNTLTVRGAALVASLVCLLGLEHMAFAGDHTPPARILVTGEGSTTMAPDMASVMLSVSRDASTAREALTANSAAMTKVLDAMAKLGIAKRDLQTSSFDIQPRYTYPQPATGADQAPRLVGYTVRNSLTVRVRDIARVGEVVDTAVTLGVNEGGSIQFTNDDPAAAIAQARAKAVEDAMARARTLAEAAGVKIGRVLEISEQGYAPGPMPMAKMEMAMDSRAGAAPIAAGESSYKVMVNLAVAIAQ